MTREALAPETSGLALLAGLCLLAGAGGAVAAAPPASGVARQCFYSRDITNWRAVGETQVNLELRHHEVYRLDLTGPCPGLRFAGPTIALEQSGGGGPICSGLQADILVPGQGPMRCPVQAITRLTPDQARALPKRERP